MRKATSQAQRGTTLIETLIATAICTVVVFGLAGLVTMATRQSKEMGTTVSQASTLAAQKLEELMSKEFTSTTVTCGTRPCIDAQLCLCATPPCKCGEVDPTVLPVTGFVDYLKNDGTPTTATGADRFFTRRWQVEALTTFPATVRRITVRVEGRAIGVSSATSAPSATLACFKGQL